PVYPRKGFGSGTGSRMWVQRAQKVPASTAIDDGARPMQNASLETRADMMLRAMADVDFVLGSWSDAGHEPDGWQSAQLSTAIDEYRCGRYASTSSMIAVTLERASRRGNYNSYLRKKAKGLADLKRAWKIASGPRCKLQTV